MAEVADSLTCAKDQTAYRPQEQVVTWAQHPPGRSTSGRPTSTVRVRQPRGPAAWWSTRTNGERRGEYGGRLLPADSSQPAGLSGRVLVEEREHANRDAHIAGDVARGGRGRPRQTATPLQNGTNIHEARVEMLGVVAHVQPSASRRHDDQDDPRPSMPVPQSWVTIPVPQRHEFSDRMRNLSLILISVLTTFPFTALSPISFEDRGRR